VNTARLFAFIRFEISARRTQFLMPLMVAGGLVALTCLFKVLSGGAPESFPTFIYSLGMLFGLETAVSAHRADKLPGTAPFFLMLPASHAERFFARWLLSFGLTLAGTYIVVQTLTLAFGLVGLALGREVVLSALFPSGTALLSMFLNLLAWHGVFFAGGVFFSGNAFLKTVFSVLTYGIALAVVFGSVFGSIYFGSFMDVGRMIQDANGSLDFSGTVLRIAFGVLLPLLLYAASYARVAESEVRG